MPPGDGGRPRRGARNRAGRRCRPRRPGTARRSGRRTRWALAGWRAVTPLRPPVPARCLRVLSRAEGAIAGARYRRWPGPGSGCRSGGGPRSGRLGRVRAWRRARGSGPGSARVRFLRLASCRATAARRRAHRFRSGSASGRARRSRRGERCAVPVRPAWPPRRSAGARPGRRRPGPATRSHPGLSVIAVRPAGGRVGRACPDRFPAAPGAGRARPQDRRGTRRGGRPGGGARRGARSG